MENTGVYNSPTIPPKASDIVNAHYYSLQFVRWLKTVLTLFCNFSPDCRRTHRDSISVFAFAQTS